MNVTLNRTQAIQMLTKIGARMEEGGRHTKVSFEVNGKKVLQTVFSRGSKDIPTGTAKSEYSGESVPPIPGESVPLIPDEYVPPIPEQSVPPFSCQICC